ncbi:MAG: FxLYD domain-containing protein [Chloroflexota bacterium]
MKQIHRWIAIIIICVIIVLISGFTTVINRTTYGSVLVNETSTATPEASNPTIEAYLPYIERGESEIPPVLPTPTFTPTPTNMPTPKPTTIPRSVNILSNHSSYVNSINYLHIVGEVQNNTLNHLRFIKISVNIFNDAGELLETDFTYTYLDNLPAGDKTCFNILLKEPDNWSYYEFEAPDYRTDGEALSDLSISNDSGSYDSSFGWYEIIGQVRNNTETRVDFVSPIGTLYNGSGSVIGCDFTYVNSTDLEPDQISAFDMNFSGRDYVDADTYRLQVDGNSQ